MQNLKHAQSKTASVCTEMGNLIFLAFSFKIAYLSVSTREFVMLKIFFTFWKGLLLCHLWIVRLCVTCFEKNNYHSICSYIINITHTQWCYPKFPGTVEHCLALKSVILDDLFCCEYVVLFTVFFYSFDSQLAWSLLQNLLSLPVLP